MAMTGVQQAAWVNENFDSIGIVVNYGSQSVYTHWFNRADTNWMSIDGDFSQFDSLEEARAGADSKLKELGW